MPADEERLVEIRARERSATDGPWGWDLSEPIKGHYLTEKPERNRGLFSELVTIGDGSRWVVTATKYTGWCDDPPMEVELSTMCASVSDADFIAASRSDVPYLLALADRLTADLTEARRLTARIREAFIKHRTATHEVAPTFCKTCQESDAALAHQPGERREGDAGQ